jgi:hypothetical protein
MTRALGVFRSWFNDPYYIYTAAKSAFAAALLFGVVLALHVLV